MQISSTVLKAGIPGRAAAMDANANLRQHYAMRADALQALEDRFVFRFLLRGLSEWR